MPDTRVCNLCGEEKPLDTGFYRQKDGRGGYMAQCTSCNNSRPPTVNRIVRNRARGRAFALLAERHAEEFTQLLDEETIKAQAEHDRIAAAAAARGAADANIARIKPGPKREGQTDTVERLDVERCPHCATHHAADHQCPGCGAYTPKEPNTPLLLGKPTPPYVIREWAYLNDVPCAPRGPIPRDVLVRYTRANQNARMGCS